MKRDNRFLQVFPSILSGDFGCLAAEAQRIEAAGGDGVHIDIMDGHFVPNLTLGPRAVAAINRATSLFLDVHLMIYQPFEYIERFIEAGADRITIHFEATEDIEDTLNYIRKCKVQAGLAFCPDTSESLIVKYLNKCDLILLMTVHPGFGGQAFMHNVLEKIRFVRGLCNQLKICRGGVVPAEQDQESLPPFDIQVDGGLNAETTPLCVEAGANVLVAGTYLFQAKDMKDEIQRMKGL